MKVRKYLLKTISLALAACLMVVFLCACESASVSGLTVKVLDGRNTYVIKNSDGQTVADILEFLGIELGADDKVSLGLDEKITADTTIEISRRCTVTVINGEIEKKVTCVGGTVADALKLANIKLKDTQTTNYKLDEPLEDGMCICIIRAGARQEETTESTEKETEKTEKETIEKETAKAEKETANMGSDTDYSGGSDDDYYYEEPGDGGGSSNPQPSPTPEPEEPETEGTTERYEISREIIYDLGDQDHGVIIITYSDLTQEEIRF